MEDEIRAILKDFKPLSLDNVDELNFRYVVIEGSYKTNYLIQIIFFNILRFSDCGPREKSYWGTFFEYKRNRFFIEDSKILGWRVSGEDRNLIGSKIVETMKRKLELAIDAIDTYFYKLIQNEKNELGIEFYLNNSYAKLFSYYSFYRQQTKDNIRNYKNSFQLKERKNSDPFELVSLVNKQIIKEISCSKYCFPLILSFFSLLEFLLLAFFVFQNPDKNFKEVKSFQDKIKHNWGDGFKSIFDIKEPIINTLFENLTNIKKDYRNPLSHGISGNPSFLVNIPGIGLIPQSYKYLNKTVYYGYTEITVKEAEAIIKTFNKFIQFIENTKPYSLYMIYLKSNLPIPINSKDLRILKTKMKTVGTLRKYIKEEESKISDYFDREISYTS